MANDKEAAKKTVIKNFKKIIDEFKKEKVKIEKGFKLDLNNNFNFFEVISDTYKKENLHSDLMKQILDPTTKEIGNINYLKSFLEILKIKDFGDLQNVKVERERNRIDILISNEKNAIIIENKINYATDQDNQLERYYEIVSLEKKVKKIVYVTLSSEDSGKPSNLNNYVNKKAIEDILIHLPAVSKDYKNSLLYWLDKCIKIPPENNIGKIFLEQYKQLLAYLGGDVLMLKDEEKVIKEIFNSKKNLELVKDLIDIWNKKSIHLCCLIASELELELTNIEGYKIYAREFNDNVKKYVCALGEKNKNIQIGFYSAKKKFKNPDLDTIKKNYNYVDGVKWYSYDKWIYMDINSEDYTYEVLKDLIKNFFDSTNGQRSI